MKKIVKRGSMKGKFRRAALQIIAERKQFWRIWAELDQKEENELTQQAARYKNIKDEYSKRTGFETDKNGNRVFDTYDDMVTFRIGTIAKKLQDQARAGYHKKFQVCETPVLRDEDKIDLNFIKKLISEVEYNRIIKYENVWQILKRLYTILKAEPNCPRVTFPKKMTVVGDIHGQLDDLLHILRTYGYPSKNHFILFNGDFVDRGTYSCECVLVMFALKIAMPDYVFLNRGNHEAADLNEQYGFEKEVLEKYDNDIFYFFGDLFGCLPLAHIINEKVFVVHGGLSTKNLTVNEINSVNRFYAVPVGKGRELMSEFLWSDPINYCKGDKTKGFDEYMGEDSEIVDMKDGRGWNNRGCGIRFGPDLCEEFMKRNGFSLVVRSHESVDEGYEWWFDKKLITVFSASNYCGDAGNKGAVLSFTKSNLSSPTILTYMASKNVKSDSERTDRLKKMVISKLLVRIANNRQNLENWFQLNSPGGMVSSTQWTEGLNHVLGLNVPFHLLQRELGLLPTAASPRGGKQSSKKNIDYTIFLSRFHPSNAKMNAPSTLHSRLSNLLFSNRIELEALFRVFDKDKNGSIDREEFTNGLLSVARVHGFDEVVEIPQIDSLWSQIDKDGNGLVDYAEFFDAFAFGDIDLGRDSQISVKVAKRLPNPEAAKKTEKKKQEKLEIDGTQSSDSDSSVGSGSGVEESCGEESDSDQQSETYNTSVDLEGFKAKLYERAFGTCEKSSLASVEAFHNSHKLISTINLHTGTFESMLKELQQSKARQQNLEQSNSALRKALRSARKRAEKSEQRIKTISKLVKMQNVVIRRMQSGSFEIVDGR